MICINVYMYSRIGTDENNMKKCEHCESTVRKTTGSTTLGMTTDRVETTVRIETAVRIETPVKMEMSMQMIQTSGLP